MEDTDQIIAGILDDEQTFLDSLIEISEKHPFDNFKIVCVSTQKELLNLVKNNAINSLVADYKLKGPNGVSVIERALELNSNLPNILMSNYQSSRVNKETNFPLSRIMTKSTDPVNNFENIHLHLVREHAIKKREQEQQMREGSMVVELQKSKQKIDLLTKPLLTELELMAKENITFNHYKLGELSAERVIQEIKDDSEIGQHYLKMMSENQNMFVQLRNPEFRKTYGLDRKWWHRLLGLKK